jgi:hypothetical protein
MFGEGSPNSIVPVLTITGVEKRIEQRKLILKRQKFIITFSHSQKLKFRTWWVA